MRPPPKPLLSLTAILKPPKFIPPSSSLDNPPKLSSTTYASRNACTPAEVPEDLVQLVDDITGRVTLAKEPDREAPGLGGGLVVVEIQAREVTPGG